MIGEFVEKYLPFFNNKSNKQINSIPGLKGNQKIDYILELYNNAVTFKTEDLDRASEMWNLYKGIDNSQYPDKVLSKMIEEGRNPFQGNFIRSKVDGLAGSIIKNFFDISFEPVNGEHSDLTRNLKELMLTDKELLDWNQSYLDLVRDGLIHLGVEEMYISFRYNPLGNIGFRRIMPGHIVLDPYWLSNNSWELKRAWKTAYLTVQEIKDLYKSKNEEIDIYLKMKEGVPEKFDIGDDSKGYPFFEHFEVYNDKYRVIEYHHLEKEKRKVEVVVSNGLVVPEGPDELKREWAIVNNIDLSDGVMNREEEIDCYYVTSICPSISRNLVLEDKKALIQIGRLPFFPWSCARINGKDSGIPDLLKSVQQTYNYRESMLDYMISTSANGAHLIDPLVVDSDSHKMDQLVKNWNKSSFKMFSSPGAISSGREFVKELPRTNVDYGIVNELQRMLDVADRISKQPAVMDGRSEGSEETGILYARKQIQAETAQAILFKTLEQHYNEKGEAYLFLAKQLYSGVYREFYILGSNKKIELNKPTVSSSGEVIENDISTLPRMKVIISQSPEGVTTRDVDRAINTDLLRAIGNFSPMNRALSVKNIMKTLNNAKSERQQYEESANLEYELAKEQTLTQILQLKSTQIQLQNQLMSVMQPQVPNIQQVENQQSPEPSGNPAGTLEGNMTNAGTV
jgi:hypothetical protein